ncbi:hypothetical protein EYF80_031365 [Liparis tanakae]|uniref:Uncharacterized protein n=1 Tax=Liparis tanakae TaxID=230148 RepID=A0A4Z2H0Q5_9TELE|nr:hypothetical protein EYF80_031365 [Liparis tanakae]
MLGRLVELKEDLPCGVTYEFSNRSTHSRAHAETDAEISKAAAPCLHVAAAPTYWLSSSSKWSGAINLPRCQLLTNKCAKGGIKVGCTECLYGLDASPRPSPRPPRGSYSKRTDTPTHPQKTQQHDLCEPHERICRQKRHLLFRFANMFPENWIPGQRIERDERHSGSNPMNAFTGKRKYRHSIIYFERRDCCDDSPREPTTMVVTLVENKASACGGFV